MPKMLVRLMLLVAIFCGGCLFYNDAKRITKLDRVSKGFPANIWDVSHITAVIIKKQLQLKTAANIISKYWVVSSADTLLSLSHSIITAELAYVRGNTSWWNGDHGFYKDHLILNCILHDQFIPDQYDYDIALVKVKQPFDARFEKPIGIAPPNYKYKSGTGAIVVGWGASGEDNIAGPNDVLLSAPIKLTNSSSCDYPKKLTTRMVCAEANGRGACIYDGGGPLLQNNLMIAITSYRKDCDVISNPGIFIKVSHFYKWIMTITNNLQ